MELNSETSTNFMSWFQQSAVMDSTLFRKVLLIILLRSCFMT